MLDAILNDIMTKESIEKSITNYVKEDAAWRKQFDEEVEVEKEELQNKLKAMLDDVRKSTILLLNYRTFWGQ